MDVATLLTDAELRRVRTALGPHHVVHAAISIEALQSILRRRPIDVLVLDPLVVPAAAASQLWPLVSGRPAVPAIMYTSTADGMRRAFALAAQDAMQAVLFDRDDSPDSLREAIAQACARQLGERVLVSLAASLALLPTPLAVAVAVAFRSPHTVRTVAALAQLADVPPRTLSRWLRRAGLMPARTVVRAARVLRAYDYLRDSDRVKDVVTRFGRSGEAITHDTVDITGFRPSQLARQVAPDEVVRRVAARLLRSERPEVVRRRTDTVEESISFYDPWSSISRSARRSPSRWPLVVRSSPVTG